MAKAAGRGGSVTRRVHGARAISWPRIACVVVAIVGTVVAYVTQPLVGVERRTPAVAVDAAALERHVRVLAGELVPRDVAHVENLARAAEYVRAELAARLGSAELQPFTVDGAVHHNVVARAGPDSAERIVVGAHYDAAEPGIGADDNASGVAGLIELAGLLARAELHTRVELVAYALEEPPHFRTPAMGSFAHVRRLRDESARVRAMIALEMIGCFRDEPGSQSYPSPALRLLYPSTGDFIAVVGCLGQAGLVRTVKRAMAESMGVPVRSINAPRWIPGVDFSDQLNYWDVGHPTVMVTDTAFYRNPRYHTAADTPETLDYTRMAEVVAGLHAAIVALARPES